MSKESRGDIVKTIQGDNHKNKSCFCYLSDDATTTRGAMIAAAQAVEHYEISRYGTFKTCAGEVGHGNAVKPLDHSL